MRSHIVFVLVALSLLTLSFAFAQAPVCDPAVACFDVSLSPATLIGDIYVDGNLVVAGVNTARLSLTPTTPHLIEVRAIQDPQTPGWGDLFIYPDQSRANQSASAGRTSTIIFRPVKQYVKGMLEVTCTPRGRQATDTVACRPTLDGVPQADIAAGTKATYALPAGTHTLHTELVGDQANNWSPTTRDDTVMINAGRSYPQTTFLSATFTLKGKLKITVFPKGVVADLYLNGGLLTSQVSTTEVFVAPGTYTIEAKSVTDPAANGLYVYADTSKSVTVYAASTRSVSLSPKKTWLFGLLNVRCQINRKASSDDARCLVNSDGTDLGTVETSQSGKFNLPVGPHTLTLSVVGANAGQWDGPVSLTTTIFGGRNAYTNARFNLKPIPTPSPMVAIGRYPQTGCVPYRALDFRSFTSASFYWCVVYVEISLNSMEVRVSWEMAGGTSHYNRDSDQYHYGIYLIDNLGNHYDHTAVSDAANGGYWQLGSINNGSFFFPPPLPGARTFELHDDTYKVIIPITLTTPAP